MPVHEIGEPGSYRQLETRQRSAEAALFLVASAMVGALQDEDRNNGAEPVRTLQVTWGATGARDIIDRLQATYGRLNRLLFAGGNFSWADLSWADLSWADLSGADLRGAHLSDANLSGADLSGANLRGAHLSDANLSDAHLSGANLSGANLSDAHLSGANLSGANLVRADLSDANLSGANLSGANLSGANLRGADLSDADLSDADLRGAHLRGAHLRGARLSGADLRDADLRDANLSGANLDQSTNLKRCTFAATRFRLVDLSVASDIGSEIVKSSFGVRAGFGLVHLPPGVPYPDHWHVANEAEEDSEDLQDAFQADYEIWLRQRRQSC
ncbi:pentapeptide repeat-containing protein [Rhodovulum sulfidophilum]|nr:pentapeptide repeat-containing protein [Rhodovulum sulfidophilum]